MQETIKKHEQTFPAAPPPMATSQRGTAIQLGFSHLVAGVVALGLSFLLTQFGIQQAYIVLLALVAAGISGLLCTLNLQYSLYLLELTLSYLSHDRLHSERNKENNVMHRWPLGPLFLSLQELEQRIQHLASTELREKALRQVREAAAQSERNRIARELHDSIKQQIFSMSVSAAAVKALWQGENTEEAREAVEDIQRSAKEAQVEMQALLQQLRPAPLENTSLVEALHIQAQALSFRTGAQMHVDIEALPENRYLLPGTPEAIFRLAQEAFANIAKHARARTVWLTLHVKAQALQIEIRDDGQGFDTAQVHKSMGLNNLHKRAQDLHGRVEISSQPGRGTTILISIPLLEALHSPEEEARRQYELARAEELARRGYQLCANASFLGLAIVSIGIIALLSPLWSIVVLGLLLVAAYGYSSGAYYRARVALSAGRESRAALKLARHQYNTRKDLVRLTSLSILYTFNLIRILHTIQGWWLLIGIFICLVGFIQYSRKRYYQDTERYYALLSTLELGWELEGRGQIFTRSLTTWCVACAIGLIYAHSLFVLPPQTPAQQNAYGIAAILCVVGIGLIAEYFQIQHWKQRLHARGRNVSAQEEKER